MTNTRVLEKIREKVFEVSAAGVVIYKNKVAILYDRKYKHYVLPQGHKKTSESLIDAAKREVTEETGFSDLQYSKKIYSYKYNFPRKNQTVYKTIHVYLFKLRTMKKKPQAFEEHEFYKAQLVPLNVAVEILHWPQDKLVIKKAKQELKKAPVR